MMRPDPINNKDQRLLPLLLACACILFFMSCGSGTDSLTASGGIGGTGVTIGEVSGYGSIFVNGVEFDTRQADLYVEDEYIGTGDGVIRGHLPIGQQVVVRGDFTGERSGTAMQIDVYHRVLGTVQAVAPIDEDSLELTIMGQTVYVNRQTVLSGLAPDAFEPGMRLRISGPVDGDGAVHAGLISPADASDPAEVKGRIQALDIARKTFRINGLTVMYGAIAVPPQTLAHGMVSVKGTVTDDVMTADEVVMFQTESIESADEFCIDGFITGPPAVDQWRMGDYDIQLGDFTRFEGLEPEDIGVGTRVRVRGRLRQRVLEADRVDAATAVRLVSTAAALDVERHTLTLTGMDAVSIHVNRLTRLQGGITELSRIAAGDVLRVYGFAVNDRTVFASAIFSTEAGPQDSRFLLQGPVTALSGAAFAILGVDMNTSANSGIVFWSSDLRPLSVEEFLRRLDVGTLVRVSGRREQTGVIYESMIITR